MKNNIKKIIYFQKIAVMTLVLIFIISLSFYFKFGMYYADRYGWYINFADENFNKGNLHIALAYANKAIGLDDVKKEAYAIRAMIYVILQRYDLSEMDFNTLKYKALENNDKESLYYYYRSMGVLRLRQGILNESLEYLNKGIEEEYLEKDAHLSVNYAHIAIIKYMEDDFGEYLKYFYLAELYLNQSLYFHREDMSNLFDKYGVESPNSQNIII